MVNLNSVSCLFPSNPPPLPQIIQISVNQIMTREKKNSYICCYIFVQIKLKCFKGYLLFLFNYQLMLPKKGKLETVDTFCGTSV